MADQTADGPAPAKFKDRFEAGDTLRGLAAIAVVGTHAAILVAIARTHTPEVAAAFGDRSSRAIYGAGNIGVGVFFCLSAYLLTRPFMYAFSYGKKAPATEKYFVRRIMRIVPLFWVAAALVTLRHGTNGASLSEIIAFLGFSQVYHPGLFGANIPAWTLDNEMTFYILIPLFAFLFTVTLGRMPRTRQRLLIISAILFAVTALGWLFRGFAVNDYQEQFSPLGNLRQFLPGIGFAAIEVLALQRILGSPRGKPVAYTLFGLGLIAALFCVLISPADLDPRWASMTAGSLFVGAALTYEWTTGLGHKLLTIRWIAWIGERSYGFYLTHGLVIAELNWLGRTGGSTRISWLLVIVVTCAISGIIAHLLHIYIELPGMRLGKDGLAGIRARLRPATAATTTD